ncbi:hypothetical protein IVA95_26715 [Bradyrhizobium sp. 157]|nr:hypothetical protein [Bradyrhizobium sp. 157]
MPSGFLLQNLRFDVARHPPTAISVVLRHLCRSLAAITNDWLGLNFADLS